MPTKLKSTGVEFPDGSTQTTEGVTSVSAGNALTGGGSGSSVTINHEDTSSQGSVSNSDSDVIQSVTLDDFGHVTGLSSTSISAGGLGTTRERLNGSGTFTVPSGVEKIRVFIVGAGGGGATSADGSLSSGSGGGSSSFGGFSAAGGGGGGGVGGSGGSGGGSGCDGNAGSGEKGGGGGSGGFGGGGSGGGPSGSGDNGTDGGGGGGGNIEPAGGGGGLNVQDINTSPSSTFSYASGSGGSGANDKFGDGGDGGDGFIVVEY